MKNTNKFLLVLLIAVFCLLLSSCASIIGEDADVIVTGNILNENENVEAIAIKNGQKVYSGTVNGVIRYLGKDTVIKAYSSDIVVEEATFLGL